MSRESPPRVRRISGPSSSRARGTPGNATPSSSSALVLVEQRGGVRVLRLNRPEKLNALSHALIDGLLGAVAAAGRDAATQAIVVFGSGRAFCAGADLDEIRGLQTPAAIRAHALQGVRLQAVFRKIAKPVVCGVHGYAFGAGCGLVAASDLAVASESAKFGYPEITRNVLPALVLPNLCRQVGRKAAFALLATGQPIDARTALALGLVNEVVPESALEDSALHVAAGLCARDPATLTALKKLFVQVTEQPFQAALRTAQIANERCRVARLKSGAAAGTAQRGAEP